MKIRNLIYAPLIALAAFGCTADDSKDTTVASQLGKNGVMPTLAKIYVEDVKVGPNDGDLSDMRKAHLLYTLSADLVVDDYSILEGGAARCVWSSNKADTVVRMKETILAKNEKNGNYECAPTVVDFNKTEGYGYDPDTVITISFKDINGNPVKRANSEAVYATTLTLNTADRHNIVNLATSPTSVLFQRTDGLFQSGYTAYRGITGLEKYIGTATYEALIKSPGGFNYVRTNDVPATYNQSLANDKDIINKWLNGESDVHNIKSKSAFVSSYGPPIALPPFKEGEIDYNKLRIVLMRHNNYPVIISNDKKLYTMGSISRFTESDLKENYRYQIRTNDNWFAYSGVDVYGNTASDKLHIGEIKPMNGVEARFVTTLSVTSDLGTIISLNETDKEYYIAGNPHYNNSFCKEKAKFNSETFSFDFSNTCTYDPSVKVGAVKIPGLQRLIGDGTGSVATDNAIYYTGNDGKVYVVRIKPTDANHKRILNGEDVMPEPLVWEYTKEDLKNGADKLYAIEVGLPNMNPALFPTVLLNDGSVAFPIRKASDAEKDDDGNYVITNHVRHFYINADGKLDHKAGDVGNIRIIKLLGPTAGYGEDDNIYYFTDTPALGISYNPQKAPTASGTKAGENNVVGNEMDKDYLAFVYGDPVQEFGKLKNASREKLFQFTYGKLNINETLKLMADPNGDASIDNNFVLMPYNPYTESFEEISQGKDGIIEIKPVPYRPFRTNAHLFVNLNKNAKLNYILVPHYIYAFDKKERVDSDTWIYKKDGLLAAEVRHNDISRVYGAFSTPDVPFKYTPYGRNTAYFANKKGIFSFVNYNVRKTKSPYVDINGTALDRKDLTANKDNVTKVKVLADNYTPDYFYRAKIVDKNGGNIDPKDVYEESFSKNNYIGNAFVNEARISNLPNNGSYLTNGFEPQLLSSYMRFEAKEYPSTENQPQASLHMIPAYIPQYLFERVTQDKYAGIGSLAEEVTKFIGKGFYQYAYGAGMYRVYSTDVYPVWRARKNNTEILQLQTRFATLMPMTHGETATFLFKNFRDIFQDGVKFNNTELEEKDDNKWGKYLYPRIYTTSLYTTYDADMLRELQPIEKVILAGIDISNTNLGETIQKSASADKDGKQGMTAQGSGVGYVLLDGNYMWRAGSDAAKITGKPVSNTDPLNKAGYFTKFVSYH